MKIELFNKRLEKLSVKDPSFRFFLHERTELSELYRIEQKLKIKFPEKILLFYIHLNALKTENPAFSLIPVDDLEVVDDKIHFATFDNTDEVCFLHTSRNSADEWTIVHEKTNFEITKTISSFWSNKIWHWLENLDRVWTDHWWEEKRDK